ncbi:hypothetical protein G6F43_007192 [Rhizopus delemar]|nr:hypothetical protein G6F43_007192 [Rhizopus delemar]
MTVSEYLIWHRFLSLSLTILLVLLSLYDYSLTSEAVSVHERSPVILISQVVLDRRLISTLVASQASIFCSLLVMLIDPGTESSVTERVCQVLMPLGLSASWLFSIAFDLKTMSQSALFGLTHGMKYICAFLFLTESFVTGMERKKIELSLDEKI